MALQHEIRVAGSAEAAALKYAAGTASQALRRTWRLLRAFGLREQSGLTADHHTVRLAGGSCSRRRVYLLLLDRASRDELTQQ